MCGMAKKGKPNPRDIIIQNAVEQGLSKLLEDNPRFHSMRDYIGNHIDPGKVSSQFTYYVAKAHKLGLTNPAHVYAFVGKKLASYIGNGGALDNVAKEGILRKSLRSDAKGTSAEIGGWTEHPILKLESWVKHPIQNLRYGLPFGRHVQYVDRAASAFKEIYEMFKTGDYAERMPELHAAAEQVDRAGFLDAAVGVLKHYKMLSGAGALMLRERVRGYTKRGVEAGKEAIKKYTREKTAAATAAIIGIGMFVITGMGLTGNVVGDGVAHPSVLGISLGVLFIAIALLILAKIGKNRMINRSGNTKKGRGPYY